MQNKTIFYAVNKVKELSIQTNALPFRENLQFLQIPAITMTDFSQNFSAIYSVQIILIFHAI